MPDASNGSLEDDMVAWGKVIVLETRGRRSGKHRRATLGFSEAPHGALLVAAADDVADWAQNLIADPRCRVVRATTTEAYRAQELEGEERRAAIVALIVKYGTPAERQGAGPAFRLLPADAPR